MNIEGLDYNTQRARLILAEYGREVQQMVDHAIAIEDRQERQACAEAIIKVMSRLAQQKGGTNEDKQRKLWDDLALISGGDLDIDYPFEMRSAEEIAGKPEPLPYPMQKIPVRHYGMLTMRLLDELKQMPEGPELDELISRTANQMKYDLVQWGQGSGDHERVVSDMARLTDGRIQLDLSTFRFAPLPTAGPSQAQQPKKKKKK